MDFHSTQGKEKVRLDAERTLLILIVDLFGLLILWVHEIRCINYDIVQLGKLLLQQNLSRHKKKLKEAILVSFDSCIPTGLTDSWHSNLVNALGPRIRKEFATSFGTLDARELEDKIHRELQRQVSVEFEKLVTQYVEKQEKIFEKKKAKISEMVIGSLERYINLCGIRVAQLLDDITPIENEIPQLMKQYGIPTRKTGERLPQVNLNMAQLYDVLSNVVWPLIKRFIGSYELMLYNLLLDFHASDQKCQNRQVTSFHQTSFRTPIRGQPLPSTVYNHPIPNINLKFPLVSSDFQQQINIHSGLECLNNRPLVNGIILTLVQTGAKLPIIFRDLQKSAKDYNKVVPIAKTIDFSLIQEMFDQVNESLAHLQLFLDMMGEWNFCQFGCASIVVDVGELVKKILPKKKIFWQTVI
jgi:hypothetical protein